LLALAVPPAAFLVLAERLPEYRAALRGAAAGWEGGITGAVSKQVIGLIGGGAGAVFSDWSIWGLAVLGPVDILLVNAALRAGRLSSAMVAITVAGPVSSLFLAGAVFDEQVAAGAGALAGAAIAAVVGGFGIAALARSESLLALDASARSV